jgi:hypothetical protein
MTAALVPLAEATLFTLGCILIHALRRHADVVTATLACFATLLVLMIGLTFAPEQVLRYQSASLAEYGFVDPASY